MKITLKIGVMVLISTIILSACSVPGQEENENESMIENQNEADLENSNDDYGFEIDGFIESMDNDTLIIDGVTVYVNPAVIGDLSLEDGDLIQIQGVRNEDGSITAFVIELLEYTNANTNETNDNYNSNDDDYDDDNDNDYDDDSDDDYDDDSDDD